MSIALQRSRPDREAVEHIEDKVVFGNTGHVEFSIYNTNVQAKGVVFKSSNPLYCGMLQGKKLVHTDDYSSFEFVPGESLMIPAHEQVSIDFLHADLEAPTKCLKVEIDPSRLNEIIARLNEQVVRVEESEEWRYEDHHFLHFPNTPHIDKILEELVQVSQEQHMFRPALLDIKVMELVIRVLQLQSVIRFLKHSKPLAGTHPLAHLAEHIKTHLEGPLSMEQLAREAHMSIAQLFRHFRNEFGMTPVQYINELRVDRAKHLLHQPRITVTEVCHMTGLNSLSYFIQLFKNTTGLTPKQYQHQFVRKNTETPVLKRNYADLPESSSPLKTHQI